MTHISHFYKYNQKLNLQIANQQRSATDPILVLVHNRPNVKKKSDCIEYVNKYQYTVLSFRLQRLTVITNPGYVQVTYTKSQVNIKIMKFNTFKYLSRGK